MATTEARLNQLYNRAREVLGAAEAETMMEAMREGMRGDLVTGADLRETTAALRSELQESTATLRSELQESVATLRSEMQESVATLRSEMYAMEQRMTRTFVTWLLASQGAFTAIVAAFFTVAR